MIVFQIFASIVIFFMYVDSGQCFVEFAASMVGGALGGIVGSIPLCRFKECCTDDYIPADLELLNTLLENELYAQHVAVKTVLKALRDHIRHEKPEAALVMSFHGASGTGKNFMVNLIVDALYNRGAKSKYVHYYNGHLDFHSTDDIPQYKHRIEEEITNHLSSCPRSIFIFDKVEFIPASVLDTLILFLDYNPRILKVNHTQAIFIFISNIGADLIEKELIRMWEAGRKRKETKLEDFEILLENSAFDGKGGFHNSDIIKMNLINHYVPFLPLQEIHVKQCVDAAVKKIAIKPTTDTELNVIIDEVLTHMTFGPPPYNLYSESGCKRVNSKVSYIVKNREQHPVYK